MAYIVYDGSFEGLLSVVFHCYQRKVTPNDICKDTNFQDILFADKETVATDELHATRVWKAIQKKLHKRNKQLLFKAFLSEETDIELILYRFIRRLLDSNFSIETDYGDKNVLQLKKLERKVMQEAARMLQFVRFQKTKDGIFFAPIEPAYDVLPFVIRHFKDRFADQQWLIYDLKRDYGFFYNLKKVEEVVLSEKSFSTTDGKVDSNFLEEDELAYQTLWKDYFNAINIKARKNLKLQRQHMPRRYWKFLPEKQ
ncbi:TIGR03915 family putative DNA repair protein [uncultured Sunxiuqinia sp.]|uniref:TIGR03915 family putative DNA repair protein n=1 Tax=uncultured Sunxiuqinia sp. TaxID=1573825 RepID=UPI002AA69D50|nr:TIGR03915 family putative DNA repair protein [uncultured Sunxiuqinia sp.]